MKRIVGLILAISMLFCLFSCGAEDEAKSAVSGMMDAFKALDFETAGKYVAINDIKIGEDSVLSEDGKAVTAVLFDKLSYEIVSTEKVDDNTVKVKTKITAVDMSAVISEYAASALEYAFSYAFSTEQPSDEEKIQKNTEFFMDAVEKNSDKKVTAEIDITVVNKDGAWTVQPDEALTNALFGGLEAAVKKLEESFNSIGE